MDYLFMDVLTDIDFPVSVDTVTDMSIICPHCKGVISGHIVRSLVCVHCESSFTAKRWDAKFCSASCRVASHRGKRPSVNRDKKPAIVIPMARPKAITPPIPKAEVKSDPFAGLLDTEDDEPFDEPIVDMSPEFNQES